jgi:hypothetical protein
MNANRRVWSWGLALGALALVVGGVAIWSAATEHDQVVPDQVTPDQVMPGAIRPFMSLFDPDQPLIADGLGKQTTLEDAAVAARFPLYLPTEAGSPTEVWVNLGNRVDVVVLRYGTELVVELTPWPEGKDPAASLERTTKAFGTGYTMEIAGNPARVRPYDAEKDEIPVNAIYVVVDGVEVTLFGTSDMDRMLALAGSLEAEA